MEQISFGQVPKREPIRILVRSSTLRIATATFRVCVDT